MAVSTEATPGPAPEPEPDGGVIFGALAGLRAAAWFAPLLVPLAAPGYVLLAIPWLSSLEADAERALVVFEADARIRETVASVADALGGVTGTTVLALLACTLYLVVLHGVHAFSWRRLGRALLRRGDRARGPALACLVAGGMVAALVDAAGSRLGRVVDVATAVRPTGLACVAIVVGALVLSLLPLGAVLGATLSALERARRPRERTGALAALVLVGLLGASALLLAASAVITRFDLNRSLAGVLMPSRPKAELTLVAVARDRTWSIVVMDSLNDVPLEPVLAHRAEDLLDKRHGLTALAAGAEWYVLSERLLAFDPEAAQRAALRAVRRRGSATTAYALLVSLGSSSPTSTAREVLHEMDEAPWLRRGPVALHLLAHAHAFHGESAEAERDVARLRSIGGDRLLVETRNALPLVLSDIVDGRVRGRLMVGGRPWQGRVGLVSVQDLFSMPPPGQAVPVTWLLRLGAAADCAADGTFVIPDVTAGEHALLLLVRQPGRATLRGVLPVLSPSRSSPEVDAGTIDLDWTPCAPHRQIFGPGG